jgi:predicted dehydrogenase
MSRAITRRDLVKGAALTASAVTFHIVPRHVLGGAGVVPPSRKLNLAAIGTGGQALVDLKNMADENIVALCDVDDRRPAEAVKLFPQARRYKDFRVMLDELGDRIDAVLVATPDHTHAVAAMAVMKHGKHVFCEKPLAHSVAELRALRKEAQARKLTTQVGTQGHATDSIRVFCEWIWDGAIGNVTEVQAFCQSHPRLYRQISKLEQVQSERPPVPRGLDWGLWQGPVHERPYHPAYVPVNWRGWVPYGSGAIGDMGCHILDPVFWALDLDMPTAIQARTDGYDPEKHRDLYPEGAEITFEFPAKGKRGPVKLVWFDGQRSLPRPLELDADRHLPESGAVIIGETGKIMHDSHGASACRIIPEAKMRAYKLPSRRSRVVGSVTTASGSTRFAKENSRARRSNMAGDCRRSCCSG